MGVLESSVHGYCFLCKGLGVMHETLDVFSKIQESAIDKIGVTGP